MEEVIKVNPTLTVPEYAKYSGSTPTRVRTSCEAGALPAFKTPGGQWRILIKGNGVPWEIYEKALKRISYLEDKLKNVESVLNSKQ